MGIAAFPTSSDIFLEAEGRKIAVVQSYKAAAERYSRSIEAFGESEPVGTLEGQKNYTIQLKRIYATDDAISDGIDFYSISDFSLVIVKPDRRIVYAGCQWASIEESSEIGETVTESITIVAARRMETH
ncbi:MAG: hypothetical protein IJG63_08295 [Oscillospiraceae bacterium]|nr:hypothetical protein [Oscillospiraceae bacterium]